MSTVPASSVGGSSQPQTGVANALTGAMHAGAKWFFIISALSGINSLLVLFHAQVRFIFGLGVTQVVDEIARQAGTNGPFLVIAVNGAFLVILVLCGVWAQKGSQGAFLAGMILYALDGALLLYFSVWLDAAVHAYALFRIWQGFSSCRELAAARSASALG